MNDEMLLEYLKNKKLRFFKDRHLRKLRKLLDMKYYWFNYPWFYIPDDLDRKIIFQKIICGLK